MPRDKIRSVHSRNSLGRPHPVSNFAPASCVTQRTTLPRQPPLLTSRFNIFGAPLEFLPTKLPTYELPESAHHGQEARVQVCNVEEAKLAGGEANNITAAVTRRVAATSSPSVAPTAPDAPPRTRRSRDSPSATWSSLLPSVRLAQPSYRAHCTKRTAMTRERWTDNSGR